MNFAELRFWGYLLLGLIVVFVFRLIFGRREWVDKVGLLFLGLFLLWCVSWITFVIFLCVAIGTYAGLGWILKYHARHSSKYLLLLIPLQLLPLFYYKYADFLGNRVMGLGVDWFRDLAIPVGISFYTFQKVAFVIDTLALKCRLPQFLDYMNFAGFFPQIVAGPIERRADLLPQMEGFRFRWSAADINEGAGWMAVGLFFKCCLADNLATHFDGSPTTNAYRIWLANTLFGLRIYYDFAGYSLVAVGLARCLGVKLNLNFASPYCSTNIVEFWRRWHITLSQWFRDYLYVPLGGGRSRWWAVNVAVVFVVSGVWHGAGWNFLLWGALHAVFLILYRTAGGRTIPPLFAWLLTMLGTFGAWLCFYELNGDVLFVKLRTLATLSAYHPSALSGMFTQWPRGDLIALVCLLVLAGLTMTMEWLSVRCKNEAYYYLRRPWALGLLVLLTVLLAPGKNNGFIYFAF